MTFFEILMSLSVSLIQSPNNSSKSAINLVDKGLYATKKRWRIGPFCIYQLCGYLIYYNEKTSFKEVFEKSLAIPDYFHYLCN